MRTAPLLVVVLGCSCLPFAMPDRDVPLGDFSSVGLTVSGLDENVTVTFEQGVGAASMGCGRTQNLQGTINGIPLQLEFMGGQVAYGLETPHCAPPRLRADLSGTQQGDTAIIELTDGETTFRTEVPRAWEPRGLRVVTPTGELQAGGLVEVELVPDIHQVGGNGDDSVQFEFRRTDGTAIALEEVTAHGNRVSGRMGAGSVAGEGALVVSGFSHMPLAVCDGPASCTWRAYTSREVAATVAE